MAEFAEKLGLGFLFQDEEMVQRVVGHVVQNGSAVTGYYGSLYFDETFGDAEIVARVIRRKDGKLELSDIDTHSVGRCVWKVRSLGMNIDRKDADILEKRCVVCDADNGNGMAVINILRADVLPCFAEGEEMKLQVVAFPSEIEYFEDEEAYEKSVEPDKNGKKWLLDEGSVLPTGLLHNRNPEGKYFEKDETLDDLMLVRGTVKRLYHGKCKIGEEEWNGYIRCVIDTKFGELEIVHTMEDVPKEERNNLFVGATVKGIVTLSGDAAIYEYKDGAVYDEAHGLSLLRSVILGGDTERMRSALAEDATYCAEYSGITYSGTDAILKQLKVVQQEAGVRYFAHYATIESVKDGDELLPYGEGKKCLVLATEKPEHYESIAFIELTAEGKIQKLTTSTNGRYQFKLKKIPRVKDPLDDVKMPECAEITINPLT